MLLAPGVAPVYSQTGAAERAKLVAARLAKLPPDAISARRSFVLAAEGESFLFNPSARVWNAPFLPEVFKPFGFSHDSRYFLYLKSQGRFPGFSLYCWDLAERSEKRIAAGSVHYAVWSPVSLQAAVISLQSATRFEVSVYDLPSGNRRPIFSGAVDPEYLEWSADGRRLYFASVLPQAAESFHDQTYEYVVHEYLLAGGGAMQSFPGQAAPSAAALPALSGASAEVVNRLAAAGGQIRRLAQSGGELYATLLENNRLVTGRLRRDTGGWEPLGPGEIYAATEDGVVLRRFEAGSVEYVYAANSPAEAAAPAAFTGVYLLPYQGTAYLVQGGLSYRSGACDGRDCLVVAHKNKLGYGLDFQQTSEEGQGNQHMLAVADGTVVATANDVTCNSARPSCLVGWDDYSTNCPSNDGAGNYVVLAHPDGTYSLYAHLKSGSVQVAPNQIVRQGEFLAIQGHSGSANSPTGYRKCGDHLHYQRQTGPAVWSQSVPTDFQELTCFPSCMTAHLSANIELNPPGVSQLTVALSPSTVIGSLTTSANRIFLPAPAPSGGATVTLASSDPNRASVPSAVVVAAGSTEAAFPINVNGDVSTATNVTISALRNGAAASATLKVVPPKLSLLALGLSSVIGGATLNAANVALTGYPARDVIVSLTSSAPAVASVPPSVTVPAGSSWAYFTIQTYPVAVQQSVKITAAAGGVTKSATLTVKPGSGSVVSVSVSPKTASLQPGQTQAFTATVSGTTNTAVTWSIQPALGSISSTGLYTAPSSVSGTTTVIVRATSVADTSKYDEATVTISPPSTGGPLFSDNFSGTLANWTVVDEGTTDKPSHWQISSGVLYQTSNIYGGDGTGLAMRGTFALAGQSSWSNYTVSVRMQSTDNDAIGLMFGYRDANNYYRFSMDQQRSYRRLIKMVNGTPVLLAADAVAYQQGRWYDVQARMSGGIVEIWLDGQLLFRVNDATFTAGKIALYSWCNIGAQFDDVTVAPVAP
jgi:murein DD-endopeptidase MepM/ murein hydrolase activator NlpD